MEKLYKWLEWFFWRKLCPQPDKAMFKWLLGWNRGIRVTGWWYNFTGRIAGFFHAKTCARSHNRRNRKLKRPDVRRDVVCNGLR